MWVWTDRVRTWYTINLKKFIQTASYYSDQLKLILCSILEVCYDVYKKYTKLYRSILDVYKMYTML